MDMTPQDVLKSFVEQTGQLIDARIRTFETTIRAEIKSLATKDDVARLEHKIDKLDYDERIRHLENRITTLEEQLKSVQGVVKR